MSDGKQEGKKQHQADGKQKRKLPKAVPLRQCICCRKRAEKTAFFRVVRNKEGTFALDRSESGKLPGRGAYLCKEGECRTVARKKRALERAFSSKVPPELYDEMEREACE